MKKILGVFFVFTCFLALMLELTDGGDWSWRSYVEFVTKNIKPLPTADLTFTVPDGASFSIANIGELIKWLGDLLFYPFELIATILRNIIVIIDGFVPFTFTYNSDPQIGESGGGGWFGSFGGGGFGGGGGGAR